MRSIEHPGPVHAERVQSIPTAVRQVEIELPRGESLLDSLSAAVAAHGATSAVFSLHGGSLAPMAFFMPAESKSPNHAVYFSDRFEATGAARLEVGASHWGCATASRGFTVMRCGPNPTDSAAVGTSRLRSRRSPSPFGSAPG